jgi:hypothetical protein
MACGLRDRRDKCPRLHVSISRTPGGRLQPKLAKQANSRNHLLLTGEEKDPIRGS